MLFRRLKEGSSLRQGASLDGPSPFCQVRNISPAAGHMHQRQG